MLLDPPEVDSTLSISPLDPRRRSAVVKQEQPEALYALQSCEDTGFQVIFLLLLQQVSSNPGCGHAYPSRTWWNLGQSPNDF